MLDNGCSPPTPPNTPYTASFTDSCTSTDIVFLSWPQKQHISHPRTAAKPPSGAGIRCPARPRKSERPWRADVTGVFSGSVPPWVSLSARSVW